MPRKHRRATPLMAAVAAAGLALAAAGPTSADVMAMPMQAGGMVNVNVNFNTQLPLADMSDKTLAATQKRGRVFVYNMAKEECAVLLSTIAATCRIANLNVSAHVRNQNNANPAFIYLNGNVRYMITLKDEREPATASPRP